MNQRITPPHTHANTPRAQHPSHLHDNKIKFSISSVISDLIEDGSNSAKGLQDKKHTQLNLPFIFWLFFILQLISNLSWEFLSPSWFSTIAIVCISSIIAITFTLPAKLLLKHHTIMWSYVTSILLLFTMFIIIDYFIYFNFNNILTQDIVDIIFETNTKESSEFLSTYLSPTQLILYIISIIILLLIVWFGARTISSFKISKYFTSAFIVGGVLVISFSAYNFIKYRNGYSIPQYSTFSRIAHSVFKLKQRAAESDLIIKNSQDLLYHSYNEVSNDSLTIVLVIGESHSYYHTPVYGYDKNNMPLISNLADEKSLIWLKDVVAIDDHTHKVICSLFTHNVPVTGKNVIFPIVFKALGYDTYLYDNQYIPGNGVTFVNNIELSNIAYTDRNDHPYSDEDIIKFSAQDSSKSNLLIYHLLGSHYTYAHRYPHDRFSKFTANQYDLRYTEAQREILAHYDNSILYTDFILHSLICRLKRQNAVLIYLSDHGEEVFDIDSYLGHGNASMRTDMSFQLRVPMFVWMSQKYIDSNPPIYNHIITNANKPFLSSNISDLMLDLANAPTSLYCPTNSIANPQYIQRKRIVLHSVDFDRDN